MKGGSGGANIINMPSNDEGDWIPGDSGYVENTKYPSSGGNIGLLGENIIYIGGGMFWGHFTGAVTHRTLADWFSMVQSWNGGAQVDTKRELPAAGLLDK
jgi:Protein-glutamine gamma-glutamyltransferase